MISRKDWRLSIIYRDAHKAGTARIIKRGGVATITAGKKKNGAYHRHVVPVTFSKRSVINLQS